MRELLVRAREALGAEAAAKLKTREELLAALGEAPPEPEPEKPADPGPVLTKDFFKPPEGG